MANAKIEIVGQGELPLMVQLYNQVFKPARDAAFFRRRFMGRYNPLMMVAQVEDHPVGFFIGFELKPTVYFAWYYGVLSDFRRAGVASQLMEAVHAWSRQQQYVSIRMECHNQHRPMLHMAIKERYEIVGIRWDPDRGENLVLFEKLLAE